ncbi:MAG: hypothetical protein M3R00_10660, partial [Pseudomonadota bacterium]|nr:hypothetical protein [Pseudomonadota bacterium]
MKITDAAEDKRIRQLQVLARTTRSYSEFAAKYGINIQQQSLVNATRVISQLAAGDHFIEQHRHPQANLLSREPLTILSTEEQPLIEFVVTNLNLKHATNSPQPIMEKGAIIAVKQLTLSSEVTNRHTNQQSAIDNNVFFTLGIGDHPITPFLDGAKTVITVDIPKMRQTNPLALSGLWVSPHLTDYQLSRESATTVLGDTTYHYTHSWQGMCKTYFYQRSNGDVY